MAKPSEFAIIDIETTGMDRRRDRITEIAIFRFDGDKIIDQFSSLINPERAIPDHITRITGIDNDMVREAPHFYEVARQIVEITQDAVFVAHNASFDYNFVQKEFRRLGYSFTRKQVCTVKLSRRLLPGLKSYGLGALCKHLGIENEARHRAFGDASATVELLQHLLHQTDTDHTHKALSLEIDMAKLPPNLDKAVVDELPDATGVYYFYDAEGKILYVGKSKSVRKRVLSHFYSAHRTNRATRMIRQIHDVCFTLTGSELVALLLENEEIKRLLPPFNRAQRRQEFKIGVYADEDSAGYINFSTGEYDPEKRPLAGFSSQVQAERSLDIRGRQFQLCLKKYGVERGPGRCFHHQIHICQGACIGEEGPDDYNERARQAMNMLSYGRANLDTFLVVGAGRDPEERSVVWVKNGFYQGYGFAGLEALADNVWAVVDSLPLKQEIPDVQRIIQGYIKRHPQEVVAWESA